MSDDAVNSLAKLAREALAANDGDTTVATESLVSRFANDIDLLRAIIRDVVMTAVDARVEHAMRNKRAAIINATTGDRGAVVALATGWLACLLDMPLANGLKLRNATRQQVLEQAGRYAATAKDATHKSRWLTAIAQSVTGDRTVGDVMSDQRAAELFRETAT